MLAKVPHRLRKRLAREIAPIFQAPGIADAKALLAELVGRWAKELPEAMHVLERGFEAATQFYAFPDAHWPRLRTTNGLERLHGEIKRRIRAVGAFPDRASALRLITAVALRTTEAWANQSLLHTHRDLTHCLALELFAELPSLCHDTPFRPTWAHSEVSAPAG